MEDRSLSRLLHEVRKTAADGVGDAELLGRFAATGDEAAFELLVRRHQGLVFGVCRRILGDHHDAEDAFQATFLALARKAGGIGKRQAVAAWLFRVAYRAALTARAGRARRMSRERPVGAAADAPDDPAAAPERRELCAAVDEEVNRLPEHFRTAVVLCYLEGKTVDEAARLLGCPRGTVASRLARARKRLHSRLSRRGVGLTVGVAAAADGLVRPTVRAAVLYASGKAAGQGVSLTAVALAKKVVRAMFVKKLTTGATVATALAGVLLLGGGLSTWMRTKAAAAAPATQAAGPTAVTVSRPVRREVTPFEDFTGRVDLDTDIPVSVRVSGSLQQVAKDRVEVKKGDVLFQIDPAPFQEVLAKAEANRDAAAEPERAAAEAVVMRARRDLDASRIVAPADGYFQFGWPEYYSRHGMGPRKETEKTYSVGDHIFGEWDQPPVVASLKQSHAKCVEFDMDERSYLRYRRSLAAGRVRGQGGSLLVGLADEEGFPHEGTISEFNDRVDPNKGAIGVRGVFSDPDGLCLRGMFARVRLPVGKPASALVIAEEAIFADQGKKYVWVVNDRKPWSGARCGWGARTTGCASWKRASARTTGWSSPAARTCTPATRSSRVAPRCRGASRRPRSSGQASFRNRS